MELLKQIVLNTIQTKDIKTNISLSGIPIGIPERMLFFNIVSPDYYYKVMASVSKISFSFCMWRAPALYGYMDKLMTRVYLPDNRYKFVDGQIAYTREQVEISIEKNTVCIQNMSEYYGRYKENFFCTIKREGQVISWNDFSYSELQIVEKAVNMLLEHRGVFMHKMLHIYSFINDESVGFECNGTAWNPAFEQGNIPLFCKNIKGDFPWKNYHN